jgi:hypothetical protein
VLDGVRLCLASLFKDRAIAYRVDNGFDHFKVFQSVGVMKMVRADRAASGVIFTLDTESGFRDVVFITGAWGLGENVVQGTVDPDEFYVHKPTFNQGHRAVLRRKLGSKEIRMVYAQGAGRETTRNVPTSLEDQQRYCLADGDVLALADAAIRIESHYSERAGHPTPMDISGPRTAWMAASTSCRRGRKRWLRRRRWVASTNTASQPRERCARAAAPWASASPPARPVSSATWPSSASSSRARCWWPTPPCPTGAR